MGLLSASTIVTAVTLGIFTPWAIRRISQIMVRLRRFEYSTDTANKTDSIVSSSKTNTPVSFDDLWNTAIFFPCPRGDDPTTSINRLLFYINQAEKSLKLCIMTLTFELAYDLLIQKHKQGVEVYVFTSFYTARGKARKLKNHGIPVRSRAKTNYSTEMHNKYVIVDDRAVLTGSLNWTLESIYYQRENILVTTHSQIVPRFIVHFHEMWENFWDENIDVEGNRLDTAQLTKPMRR